MKPVSLARIDLNLLTVFLAVYDERNVTRAAKRLFTSQSGVSHSLRNLRNLFDDPLFVRTPEGMSPTALAERLEQRLRFALDEIQDVLDLRSDFDPATAQAQVVVGLLSGPPPWLVPTLFRLLGERAPGITVAFRQMVPEAVTEGLDNRVVQMVVGAPDNVEDRRRLTYSELFEDHLTCVVGRENALVGEAMDIATYAALSHLVVATGHFGKSWIDDVLTEQGLSRTIAAMVPSPIYIADILAETDLVCIIMRNLVASDSRLRLLPPPFPTQIHRFGQFSHSRDDDNPLILWLRALVQEVCEARASPCALEQE